MHTAAISLALVVVPPCWLLPIRRRRGFPQERPSHCRERLHPGWPHGHNQWCGTAAPERFSKSSTSLVPDPNPQSCRERAEESSESTRAVLEKRSPTGEGRQARVALGQPGRGNAKHRVGAAFASRKAQLVNEVGSGTLHPGLWMRGTLPLSPSAAGSPPGRAAQSSSARLQPGTQQGICSSSTLLCQQSYQKQQARERALSQNVRGFTIKVHFLFQNSFL